MNKSKPCKAGKTPTGKNGRCVKSKTCKAGKTPTGKNGRCVKSKTHKKHSTTSSKGRSIAKPSVRDVAKPSVRDAYNKELAIRRQIDDFMMDIDDDEFFTKSQIENFVKIALKKNLSKSEIDDALHQYSKDYGEFA